MAPPSPRTVPSSDIGTSAASRSVAAEHPDGVISMPSGVRALTLPELPVFMPRWASSRYSVDERAADRWAARGGHQPGAHVKKEGSVPARSPSPSMLRISTSPARSAGEVSD